MYTTLEFHGQAGAAGEDRCGGVSGGGDDDVNSLASVSHYSSSAAQDSMSRPGFYPLYSLSAYPSLPGSSIRRT